MPWRPAEQHFFVGILNNCQKPQAELTGGVAAPSAGKYLVYAKGEGRDLLKEIFDESKMMMVNDDPKRIVKDEKFCQSLKIILKPTKQ